MIQLFICIIAQNDGFVYIIFNFSEFFHLRTKNNGRGNAVSVAFFFIQIARPRLLLLHCSKALAAVYGSVACRLERNLCGTAAVSACCYEHFLLRSCYVLACIAASLASLRLVLESFFCIECLFTCCEYEILSAIFALQCFVLVHGFTSLK